MKSDKEVKKEFKKEASLNPDKFYPTAILNKEGFMRKHCKSCGLYFWTTHTNREVCGDPMCDGGFNVVLNNPSKVKLSYIDVWRKIVDLLEPRGYTPIKRYPVISRWNPTSEFTMASIAAFQPYVISGEVPPPAKKLLIPQLSLRFGDIDNVGITGSHLTGFVMIGQHQFLTEKEWSQEQAFNDIYDFITTAIGLSKHDLTIHEDAWAGGGNFGPCMEFFSRGVELFNQVYMMFEQTPSGNKPLAIKVLDMGLGMERVAWFSQGLPNIYEATFPHVLEKLRNITKTEMDYELYNKFSKYSPLLNIDEVDDINAAWDNVAKHIGYSANELKEKIMPMTAVYSIAEHSRALLFAISDGGLPSNVGGGYNLRVILRRALSFIDQFGWNIDLADVTEWHAHELHEIFPELSENLEEVRKVLDVEKKKYEATKEKAKALVEKIIQKDVTVDVLIELYDSQGISPEIIKSAAKKLGKTIHVPEDFFTKVSLRHGQQTQVHQTHKVDEIDFGKLADTAVGYFEDEKTVEFSANVLKIVGLHVVLDKTYFYPTSGGQLNDLGTINGAEVIDVFKQGSLIVHKVSSINFNESDIVKCKIDSGRRKQLMQLHSATHVVNAACRELFGNHINQAGAKKTLEKATLDITHYENIDESDLVLIEKRANQIIAEKFQVTKEIIPRDLAEKKYGMAIYQGGAVPGKNIRIVKVNGLDVEACGGTHVSNTSEIEVIKILKSSKIQDGIVRLEFVAGELARNSMSEEQGIFSETERILGVSRALLVSRAIELFKLWKKSGKLAAKISDQNYVDLIKKGEIDADLEFHDCALVESEILEKIAKELKTQKSMIPKTLKRFSDEYKANKQKIDSALS